ncbi:uncharacterized protein LOC119745850 [Patiria miniata]|uniref:Uncharacterized protein n=1 Tax=Patiria miniata TaxID=46514 RepID=A0A914BS20_PATMI|nr:uncharacterized protein LOC119745850 [Patiria miniata]
MWGKSSHVIPTQGKLNPSSQHPTPVRVSLWGHDPVARVACGSWHTMAVVGAPEWHPLEEDSEEEHDPKAFESKDTDSSVPMEFDEGRDTPAEDANGNNGSVFQKHQQTDSIDSQAESSNKRTNPVQRETTKLTLAEFYAPTPLPTISPPEEYSDEMDSEQDDEKTMEEEVEHEEQAILNTVETALEAVEYQGVDDKMDKEGVSAGELDESEPVKNSNSASFFVDLGVTSAIKRTTKNEGVIKERPKLDKGDTSTRSNQRQSRPRESNMVRSKTMPVVTRKPLMMASASTTTAFDWSEPPKPSTETEPVRDRFVIHKHVSVQMNQKGNGSGDRVKGRKPIAQIGLQTSGEGNASLSRSKERNVMPQPPKFNRAKTYYGRMNQKRPEAEPKLSQFLSSLPPAPSQTSSALTKLQPRRRLDKPAGPSDRSPIRGKQNLDLTPTVEEMKGRLPGKPVFSSASSWRMRHKEEDGL